VLKQKDTKTGPGLAAKLLEAGLWAFGLLVLAISLVHGAGALQARQQAEEIVPGSATGEPVAHAGDVIGRLEVSGLLSVPVLEADDARTLVRGVGHVPGTAVPGGLGNMVLAGHRDTYFRPLRHVHEGMTMSMTTASGTYRYRVDSTEIVTPEQVEVTAIGDRPEMTLITCYPFDFVGAAPKRFIVHTHLLSVDPA
jgi:sortase A